MTSYLKSKAKDFLEKVVIPLREYIFAGLSGTTVLRELEARTAKDCADYVEAQMPRSLHFTRKQALWDHALSKASADGLIAEFGVWKGHSINYIAGKVSPRTVYGFDSFEGLKEDWAGWTEIKGKFDLNGRLPSVASNVRLSKGWFDATIPEFQAETPGQLSFVHIDCDTYEAARSALANCGSRIGTGTVIVFDEYFGYRGWKIGEHLAWQEFVRGHAITYEYLAFSVQSVSVRVTRA
jgi:hypothetical protein